MSSKHGGIRRVGSGDATWAQDSRTNASYARTTYMHDVNCCCFGPCREGPKSSARLDRLMRLEQQRTGRALLAPFAGRAALGLLALPGEDWRSCQSHSNPTLAHLSLVHWQKRC